MSVENFFPEHYPWQRLAAKIAAGSGDEMNIGNPVVCIMENGVEPTVNGDSSWGVYINGIAYEDNIICECDWGFSNSNGDGAIASGLTLIEKIYGNVTLKFYDTELNMENGKYTSVEEIDVDCDTEYIEEDDRTTCKFVIPELEEGHVFVFAYFVESEES